MTIKSLAIIECFNKGYRVINGEVHYRGNKKKGDYPFRYRNE